MMFSLFSDIFFSYKNVYNTKKYVFIYIFYGNHIFYCLSPAVYQYNFSELFCPPCVRNHKPMCNKMYTNMYKHFL